MKGNDSRDAILMIRFGSFRINMDRVPVFQKASKIPACNSKAEHFEKEMKKLQKLNQP